MTEPLNILYISVERRHPSAPFHLVGGRRWSGRPARRRRLTSCKRS